MSHRLGAAPAWSGRHQGAPGADWGKADLPCDPYRADEDLFGQEAPRLHRKGVIERLCRNDRQRGDMGALSGDAAAVAAAVPPEPFGFDTR